MLVVQAKSPICRTAFDDVLNIIRCNRLPGVDPLCGDWNLHYANASVPLARPIVDLVDPLAEWPYNDIKFFVRPCVSCAIQICTASRLIMFERFILNNCTVFTDLSLIYTDPNVLSRDYYTKPRFGYRRSDYSDETRLTGSTAPIYMTAVLCSTLSMPTVPVSGSSSGPAAIEALVERLYGCNYPLSFYDPLEFFEWSGEFSSGSFLSDCFAPTGFMMKTLISFARMHAVQLRGMKKADQGVVADAGEGEQTVEAFDGELDALLPLEILFTFLWEIVHETRIF
ncbi:hypothetical protein C8J57DRAFT_1737679 [Mycena rebaudengoi]|nr:hypothetical protein C8J57DRAFT_1737679 [Mycena rebaudengoi]